MGIEQHRPPPHIRNEVDLSYRIKDQSIEIRPLWNNPQKIIEEMIAKTTYVEKRFMEGILATSRSEMA
jgi:hypothetical protein